MHVYLENRKSYCHIATTAFAWTLDYHRRTIKQSYGISLCLPPTRLHIRAYMKRAAWELKPWATNHPLCPSQRAYTQIDMYDVNLWNLGFIPSSSSFLPPPTNCMHIFPSRPSNTPSSIFYIRFQSLAYTFYSEKIRLLQTNPVIYAYSSFCSHKPDTNLTVRATKPF